VSIVERIEQARAILGDEFAFFFGVIHAQLQRPRLDRQGRILDVGTGNGNAAISLALCGYAVLTGEPIDDDSEYAKQAWRERARKVGAKRSITFQPFDAAEMPFPDDDFQAVFMMGALHHMRDPVSAVSECARVLAPGGVICVLEPNERLLNVARQRHPDHPDPFDPTPIVKGMALETIHDEMHDVYLIRDA
jgi:ubiquinone/menaquinone biosynthesis C-methylase UbiE